MINFNNNNEDLVPSDIDMCFVKLAQTKFLILNHGTNNLKAERLSDICDVLDLEIFKQDSFDTRKKIFFNCFNSINTQAMKLKLKRLKLNPKRSYLQAVLIVELLLKDEIISSNKLLESFINGENKPEDLLAHRYMVSLHGVVFSYDTTSRNGSHLTLMIDIGTRFIHGYILTQHPPTGEDIVELFKLVFGNKKKEERPTVHSDMAGSNNSIVIAKYCAENNIQLSFSGEQHGNQVSESIMRKFWAEMGTFYFEGLEKNTFSDYTYAQQHVAIKITINNLNKFKSRNSSILPFDCSPLDMEVACSQYPYSLLVIARNHTEEGDCIKFLKIIQFGLSSILLLQLEINKEKNIFLNMAETPEAFKAFYSNKSLERNWLVNKAREIKIKRQFFLKVKHFNTKKEIIYFAKKWLIDPEVKNLSDYDKIFNCLNSKICMRLNLTENKILIDIVTKSFNRIEKIQEKLEYLNEKEKILNNYSIKIREKRQILLRKGKFEIKKQNEIFKFLNRTDMSLIFNSINSTSDDLYCCSRDKIAHAFLRYSGLSIKLLRFIYLSDLEYLFNYKPIHIKVILEEEIVEFTIPIISTEFWVIELVREDWVKLKEILNEKNKKTIYKKTEYSEIWGLHLIKYQSYAKRLTTQLKFAYLVLNKNVTLASYRK